MTAIILHKYTALKKKRFNKAHSVKDHVFSSVIVGNLQLHSLGIKPVNIVLHLAHTAVSIQVLFHSDFDQFYFIK